VPRRRRRWLLALAGLLVAALVVVAVSGLLKKDASPGPDRFPVLPLSSSPFLNTGPAARYVGSEACRSCHPGRDASFRRTGMGRSLAEVDLAREPPDAAFDHPPSKRRYQVARKDGQLWHRELLLTSGPEEVILAEYPLKYVVGSGRHSLTYLAEAEGFLVESPVTWYASRQGWGMSPGYDQPDQQGFQRAVGEGCLVCHAGQAEAVGGSLHRMRITEAAIGCERCHGPGSLHLERHADRKPPSDGAAAAIDHTIVNPSHLPRTLAEAVCQQCHLRASATVIARGRKVDDFRPGLPLQDFRADYRLTGAEDSMTVVGHVEQMHLSRCYRKSDTLSCLTCHSPHRACSPEESIAHTKTICLKCHQPERCTVPPLRRQQESPGNNCVQCHMPTAPTEIPHLAFTHHRIGIHDKPATPKGGGGRAGRSLGVLEPLLDLSRFSAVDQKRSLGLGYLEVASLARDESSRGHYQQQALKLLSEVRTLGLQDPALDTALGRVRFALGHEDYLPYAESALAHPQLTGQDRGDALFLVADAHAAGRRYPQAVAALEQLRGLRRHATQCLLLADCERALGHDAAAESALQNAVRIDPRLWQVHQHLADRYRRQGDEKRATWHRLRAVP